MTAVVTAIFAYIMINRFIKFLSVRGLAVEDIHKPHKPLIPRPGGPAIIIPILLVEFMLYYFTLDIRILALSFTLIIAGLIGLVDDIFRLKGITKTILLIFTSLPIILLSAYTPYLQLPFFEDPARLFIIYPILIIIAIPITANTINTIDVFNGAVSGFLIIITIPIILALSFKGDTAMILAALPLLVSTGIFYLYHKYPSKIFLGDSGTLALGSMYGALAISGGVEIVAVVALFPAILNSFFFLSSVRRIVDHRAIKVRPTKMLEDYKIAAVEDHRAPVTLVRLILSDGPLSENQITFSIFKLAIVSSLLAVITGLLIR